MKKFTVKDFIKYSGPCFSCGNKITIKIGSATEESAYKGSANSTAPGSPGFPALLVPTVTNEATEIYLKIGYRDSLFLRIFHKTNKFETSSASALATYLSEHKLFLNSYCSHCSSMIETVNLEFNFLKGFVAPVGILYENILVSEGANSYELSSFFHENNSMIIVNKRNQEANNSAILKLPLLPLYKFRNRQHFIDKIKTYLIFS
jgi:hypothetical protein